MRRAIAFPLAFALLPLTPPRDAGSLQEKGKPAPNFIVFLTDDLGYGDLGCYGHPLMRTPSLDDFARQGIRFTQCYAASSVCSPSRSAILTGRTPYRNGVFTWIPAGRNIHLRRSEITVASLLKKKGYSTCHVGKWHLNGKFNSPEQPQPVDHGYDWWLATQNNAAPSHRDPTNFVRNGEPTGKLDGYSAVLVADEAIAWLEKQRNPRKPFFLAVWTHEPHLPIESDPRFMARYPDVKDEGQRQHHGNVTQIDHAFGKLMKALDRLQLTGSTCVIFTSDNGPEGKGGPEGNGLKGRTRGSTGGLRGRKRAMYEGGIRVPGMLRWPGHAEPGSVSDQPVIGSDIFTTICEIAGVPLPADRIIDGASMLPALAGKPIQRKVPMYWRYHGAPHGLKMAMRKGDWKILASEKLDRFELYDLANDPRETRNLVEQEKERLESMRATLVELNQEIEAEGPNWWKGYGRRRPRPLRKGHDRTQSFDVVMGCTVSKGDLGFRLDVRGEGFALRKLATPITGKARIRLRYRSLAEGSTKNGFLVFGDKPTNARLIKCGTAIGMGRHCVFQGPWNALDDGRGVDASFDKKKTFSVSVSIDLTRRELSANIDGHEVRASLPKDLRRIDYYGFYAKGTHTAFGPPEVETGLPERRRR